MWWLESKGAPPEAGWTPLNLPPSAQVRLSFLPRCQHPVGSVWHNPVFALVSQVHLSSPRACSVDFFFFPARLSAFRYRDQRQWTRWLLLLASGLSAQDPIALGTTQAHLPGAAPGRVWVEDSSPKNASTIVGELLLPAAPCHLGKED